MLLPQEIEVWYVLPAIRKEMCKELVGKGMTQRQTAAMFGITEAAVSQYLNSKRAGTVKFRKDFLAEIRSTCNAVRAGKISTYEGLQALCRKFRQTGCICSLHARLEKPGCMPAQCQKRFSKVCRL
jgi:predicted transcriptional regulator